MPNWSKKICCAVFFICVWHSVKAQNFFHSQYFNIPTFISPSNVGMMLENNLRVGLNIRQQQTGSPSDTRTMALMVDMKLYSPFENWENTWFGVGLYLMNDRVGDVGTLQTNQGILSLAAHQTIGRNLIVSAGIGFGIMNKTINANNFIYDDQWNNDLLKFSSQSSDPIKTQFGGVNVYNMQSGLSLFWSPIDYFQVYAGASGNYLNRPQFSMVVGNQAQAVEVPILYRTFIKSVFGFEDGSNIQPSFFYDQWEKLNISSSTIGFTYEKKFSRSLTLSFGSFLRFGYAIIPYFGIRVGPFSFSLSTDFNLSNLNNYPYQGTHEAYLMYQTPITPSEKENYLPYTCPLIN